MDDAGLIVAAQVHLNGPEAETRPEMYLPVEQELFRDDVTSGFVVVRATTEARGVADAVRSAITSEVGAQVGNPQLVADAFFRLTATRRFNAGLMSVLGGIALLLATIGVYGTMAFFVSQQVRTIGLKMALGASRWLIVRSVLGRALTTTVLGVIIGLAAALSLARTFSAFVFAIHSTDAEVFIGVAAALAVTGVGAALVPALRAARLDPIMALRRD